MDQEKIISLDTLIQTAWSELVRLGYKRSRFSMYNKEFRDFEQYCEKRATVNYDSILAQQYFRDRYNTEIQNPKTKLTQQQLNTRMALRMLDDLYTFGTVRRHLPMQYRYPQKYEAIITEYIKHCRREGASQGTLRVKQQKLRDFVAFIASKEMSFSEMTPECLSDYVITLSGYARATIHVITSSLRHFFSYLYDEGVTETNLSPFIPKPRIYAEENIPLTWKEDEVNALLESINRHSPIGKRDYAMVLMAVILGMRVGDICSLRFSNLNWNTRLITYTQQKTGKMNVLPIMPEIGEAIIDYLKNGRVETDSDNVFVRHIHPYGEFLSSSVLSESIKRYMRQAGLKVQDRKVMHSLRHTLASSLLKDQTPFMTIANVLGHDNPETTNCYTKVDLAALRRCALSYSVGGDRL
ncbi:MAG: site-specific integrase [Oscillospiraceae bacterium]|nr:site-specific integrase [Oscillospiraceae bacterium]